MGDEMRNGKCAWRWWWICVALIAWRLTLPDGSIAQEAAGEPATDFSGQWECVLDSPGGPLRFGLNIDDSGDQPTAFLVNGPERIKVPRLSLAGDRMMLDISHYDSRIEATFDAESATWSGQWRKRRGPNQWTEMSFSAARPATVVEVQNVAPFVGKWSVKFESSDDPAVGIFREQPRSEILGTFLTTTGDYRYLHGRVVGGRMELSCFDGAHAFLFHAIPDGNDRLTGDFWSSDSWHETWTAVRDDEAVLPDQFRQTRIVDGVDWGALQFPDLDGRPRRLDDPEFAGDVRLIYIFGSWCPNCHDAADYFHQLQEKYQDRGLSILGLAFELSGDFERDAGQVRLYLQRHGCTYPVLVAGLADKRLASEAIPVLDRVRSYPTTLFVDKNGRIRAVHTGFAGPATGEAWEQQCEKFEQLIEEMLRDAHSDR